MKAIVTKYLGPTNTKPSRIVAKAEGVKSVTTSCNKLDNIAVDRPGWAVLDRHQVAARLFAEKHGWSTNLASGGLPDGTWAHCFVQDKTTAKKFNPPTTVSKEKPLWP